MFQQSPYVRHHSSELRYSTMRKGVVRSELPMGFGKMASYIKVIRYPIYYGTRVLDTLSVVLLLHVSALGSPKAASAQNTVAVQWCLTHATRLVTTVGKMVVSLIRCSLRMRDLTFQDRAGT